MRSPRTMMRSIPPLTTVRAARRRGDSRLRARRTEDAARGAGKPISLEEGLRAKGVGALAEGDPCGLGLPVRHAWL